ncbi:MAG: FmdC precursor [Euryarchaeota archaeon]|nr:FmdC precursor [Euryarchaeota archaeon]
MKQVQVFLISLLLVSTVALGQQKVESKFGKGVYVVANDSSFSMKFNARVQSLLMFEAPAGSDNLMDDMTSNWLIRRSRLKFSGFAYSPKVKYKIELGLSNRDHGGENIHTNNTSNLILDAFVRWNFYKNMEVWIGQTKLPGNRERVISSQKLQFVDRSLVNSRYNIDRDMGIQFRNKFNIGSIATRQALAISQGEGRNRTNKKDPNPANGFEYTGRVEVLPFGDFTGKGDYFSSDLKREETPKASIGVTYDMNMNAARTGGNLGSYIQDSNDLVIDSALCNLNTILADVMFKYKGFSLLSEYANKTLDGERIVVEEFDEFGNVISSSILNNYYTGTGLTVQAGYLLENNLEPAIRYTTITPEMESGRDLQEMITLGLSRYIVGHSLKIQTDFSLITETDQVTNESDKEYMFRFQVEMAF